MTGPTDSAATSLAGTEEEAATLYRHAGIVTFFTLLSRILGLTRDLVIAHRLGAGGATDAWVQAFRIPNALRRLTAEGSMTIAFVPTYVRVREQQGPEAAREFARRVLGIVLAATVVLSAGGMAFSEQLTTVFSPGFIGQEEKFLLTSSLIAWTFPYLVFISLVAWAMGVLNSEGRFAAPAAAPVFLNLGIIVAVLGFSGFFRQPVLAIAGGVLVGGILQMVLQVPSLVAVRVRLLPRWGWHDENVRGLLRLLIPSLFGVAVYEINIIVLGIIASFLPTGQIFHYHNALRMTELVLGLFAFSFTMAGLPRLSEHQAHGDWERMTETIRLTFAAVLFAILPAMAGLIAAAPAIISMLYLHGAFLLPDVAKTADTLVLLALGLPAVAAVRVMVPIFYAMGDARTPVAISAATLVVTGLLGWNLSQRWEVLGLASALSAGTWFQCGLLALLLRRTTAHLGPWFSWRSLWKQTLGAVLCGLWAYGAVQYGDWAQGSFSLGNWIVFALTVIPAAAIYLGATLALGEPQARNWLALANRLLGRPGGRA